MANVTKTVTEIAPLGGATLAGYKLGWLLTADKAAQNDTVVVSNAKEIKVAFLQIVASGAAEGNTISGRVLTLTSSTTGSVKGLLIYR